MINILPSAANARRVAAVAIVAVAFPFAAGSASAAPTGSWSKAKRATWTKSSTAPASTSTPAPAATPAAAATVSSVHSIGGYVFYNVTYLEAVDLWLAAVAAAPAGYTPPPVYSVSATTTVSGTVIEPGR